MKHQPLDKSNFPLLIAEDDPVTRRLLEKVLFNAGYQVLSSKNGLEALQIMEKNFCPIVITDWMMPKVDGLELCRSVRKMTFPGYVFIIIITANDSKDNIIAGLQAGADDYITKPFNQAELRARLSTAVRVLSLEQTLKEANEQIRNLSIRDSLTNVYNRGFLTEQLPHNLDEALAASQPLSLIMCDIDHFKHINDHYGHQAGDTVLIEFCNCLRTVIGDTNEWIARYGGEEFLIILPNTTLTEAGNVAEQIRTMLSHMVVVIEDAQIGFTASFGVSSFDGNKATTARPSPDALINEADRCLYEAKKEGRNCVIVSPGPEYYTRRP